MAHTSPLLVILLLLVFDMTGMFAETYYVTPTCPEGLVSCMTLSQYATQPNNYFTSNTTLILLPGNHSLDSELKITNITQLTISASLPNATVTVTCSQSARFRFEGIRHIVITGITFVRCMNMTISSVEKLMLKDCTFNGQHCEGTGVELKLVTNATVLNSSFIANTGKLVYDVVMNETVVGGGAIIVTHNSTIFILHCRFDGNSINTSESDHNPAFSGGGAVYLSKNNTAVIEDSTFINNSAEYGGAMYVEGSWVNVTRSTFTGNRAENCGGGVYLDGLDDAYANGNSLQKDCFFSSTNFTHNSAHQGAAIYLAEGYLTSSNYINISSNIANSSTVYVVASNISFSGVTTMSNNNGSMFAIFSVLTLSGNTTFMYNSVCSTASAGVQEGGAITSFQSNLYFLDTVKMVYNEAENGGAILATESKVFMCGNVTITSNKAQNSGGGIFAFQTQLYVLNAVECSHYNITNHGTIISGNKAGNKGGGVYAISSNIRVSKSHLRFTGNCAERGGGICLELNAKLYIINSECVSYTNRTWPTISFTDNSAGYGGAVYVTDDTNSGTCLATSNSSTEQSVTSECFFQVLEVTYATCRYRISTINLNFTSNTARVAGGTLFGGLLDRCTANPFAFFNATLSGTNYFHNVTNFDKSDIASISSNAVRVCFCRNDQPDCNYQPPPKHVLKGDSFNVSVIAVDQVNNTVPNTAIHSSLSSGHGRLSEGQAIQQTNDNCTELQYTPFSPRDNENLLLYAEGPCNDTGISARHINIIFKRCPIGFQPAQQDTHCTCDPALSPYITTNCFIDNQTVLREGDFWIAFVNGSEENNKYLIHSLKDNDDGFNGTGFIVKPHCPFDYCHSPSKQVYINFSIPNGADAQCAFKRKGILCGSCGDGLSLSLGSSRCMECSNDCLALLIPFAIAGIALVAILLVFNLTVAVGTINGLIFYANIVAANSSIFLPFDRPNLLTVFIAWLNLDFGFETCFYDGMDGYAKVWLQLTFPLYIIFLVVMVIIVCEYSQWFSRLLSYTNPVATLATLILLSYSKLLRTIIAALSFTTIKYPQFNDTNRTVTVWLYDANVPYFQEKHIPLFFAAIFILLAGLVYTFLLIFWQFLLRTKIIDWMRNNYNTIKFYTWYNIWIRRYLYSFMDVYHAPYNTSHRYWTGLLLLLRGVVYIISAVNVFSDPSVNLLTISCVVMLLLVWKLNVHMTIYKGRFQNKLDIIQLANLVIFSVGTLYIRSADSGNQAALAYTSISIAFITFLCILCYHAKGIPQYVHRLAKIKINFQPQRDQRDYDEIVAGTAEERIPLVSYIGSQTEIDGLPDQDQGSQDEENSHSMCASTKL